MLFEHTRKIDVVAITRKICSIGYRALLFQQHFSRALKAVLAKILLRRHTSLVFKQCAEITAVKIYAFCNVGDLYSAAMYGF